MPSPEKRPQALQGAFTLSTIVALQATMPATDLDLTGVTAMDTAGAWAILSHAQAHKTAITGASKSQTLLLEAVKAAMPLKTLHPKRAIHLHAADWAAGRLEQVGRASVATAQDVTAILSFLGQVMAASVTTALHPKRLRMTSLVFHMQETGLKGVAIVALMAFLIGVVVAYQGAAQLRQFGAEVFVVDLIAISVLRELGILLTAIIVAGRSASAFTAVIGAMKMREEVDALRVLGLDPIEVLILPRVFGLLFMLPALGVIADLSGLFGGGLMAWYALGISPGMFLTRLLNTDVTHFVLGLVKAPFFAVIIAVIGCFQGLEVAGNTESLGRLTSRSVVQSIFLVILADAIFSILFALAGV
jgi:phospholipid/cholesterol/gamma-HCH transport system permease protein